MKHLLSLLTISLFVTLLATTKEEAPAQKTPPYSDGSTPAFDDSTTKFPTQITFPSQEIPHGFQWEKSILTPDSSHFVWSDHSLRWDYTTGSSITIKRPIPWMEPNKARGKFKLTFPVYNRFFFWIYNATPQPDAKLRISFGNRGADGGENKEVCHFSYALNFSGWRTAWVSYDSDMQGVPKAAMDYVKIEAPKNQTDGTLWIGDMITHRFTDRRFGHGDYQAPYIGGADKMKSGHWEPIMYLYDLGKKQPTPPALTDQQRAGFEKLRQFYHNPKQRPLTEAALKRLEKQFATYHISKTAEGIKGDHIYFHHQTDGAPDASLRRQSHNLKNYTGFMNTVAQTYSFLPEQDRESEGGQRIEEMFNLLTEHFLDQGFEAGSSLGTMHHFGYSARLWVPAIQLMQKPLEKAGLLTRAQNALAWFFNANRMYNPSEDFADMDYLNTLAKSDFSIQALGVDNAEKAARLQRYSTWLSEMLAAPAPGKKGGIKPDGSLFHHEMHYHGYGLPAMNAIIEGIVGPLDGTRFEISAPAYAALKRGMLAMRYWAYPYSGFNACGRHPITGEITPFKACIATLANSKPGTDEVDTDIAAAYLRMFGGNSPALFGKEIQAEKLNGFYAMNYNAGASLAFGNSTVHLKGYGDGVRSHETYKNANRYGRYLSFGTIQIFKNTTAHLSGNEEKGWDWSRLPGATTLHVPLDVLEGNTSFYGSVPKQKSFPSGAGSLHGKFGAFLFQLDPTQDPQSLRVRKSVFSLGESLVCLGSGISNTSQKYPTLTTLFQTAIPAASQSDLSAHGKENGQDWYIDPYGTGYIIPNQQSVKMTKGVQESRDGHTKKKTTGNFATAWIDHGTSPSNASYQYHILLNATPETVKAWAQTQQSNPQVKILQQDDNAHVITYAPEHLEMTAAFAPYQSQSSTLLHATDRSCIVIIQTRSENAMNLSVTDIDLADMGSKPKSPSISITLKGTWKLTEKSDIQLSHQAGNSTLIIPTHRGLSREFKLKKNRT